MQPGAVLDCSHLRQRHWASPGWRLQGVVQSRDQKGQRHISSQQGQAADRETLGGVTGRAFAAYAHRVPDRDGAPGKEGMGTTSS
jgi:hypothetical protein